MFANKHFLWSGGAIVSLTLLLPLSVSAQETASIPTQPGVEVQTRGPVHEAFAHPSDLSTGPGLAIPREPPPPIPETAPEERPQGDNVQWIGGYWAWDAERNDFIWISGTYRNAPPGRQFVPGHWANTAEGWRWVAGFWAPVGQTEPPYVDQPPAPLDTEPSLPPPDDNSMYIPGYWANNDGAFAWRPGFYTPFRAGRIWSAPRYIWSPAGYNFVDGYWDYPLEDRGLLFAPVWFTNPWWRTPGWFFRPQFVVLRSPFFNSLFWRPGWNNYFFGNFFGPAHARLGFQPWFARRHDPLFNYYRWANRGQANWFAGQQRAFSDRVAGRAAVPPHTFAQQNASNRIVAPLSQMSNNQVRITRMTSTQLNAQSATIQRANQLSQARVKQENAFIARNSGAALRTNAPSGNSASSLKPAIKSAAVPRVLNNASAPRVTTSSGVPRVVHNAPTPQVVAPHGMPRVINHTAPRVAAPQTRSVAHAPTPHFASQQRVAPPHVSHTGRTVNHTPARSSGGSGHHGKR